MTREGERERIPSPLEIESNTHTQLQYDNVVNGEEDGQGGKSQVEVGNREMREERWTTQAMA